MSSDSASTSASESCCLPVSCACEDWLTIFCDYVSLTLTYCEEVTEFHRARIREVPIEAVSPQAGVYSADKVFEVSMLEQTVDVGVGATITDEDGTEWQIFRVEVLRLFCIRRLWGRSISACFGLLETVSIIEQDCSCSDCGPEDRWDLIKKVRGTIRAERGTVRTQNDSRDLNVTYAGRLVRWPLDVLPGSMHRLQTKKGTYRIVSFTDGGPFVPFGLVLEPEHADCAVRGS